jgi:hypothetical protein
MPRVAREKSKTGIYHIILINQGDGSRGCLWQNKIVALRK